MFEHPETSGERPGGRNAQAARQRMRGSALTDAPTGDAEAYPVSVLMPVYNGLPHLRQAVESVLAQTFRDFEFVIVDDGSTDGSSVVLQRYADRDDRIVLVRTKRQGVAGALNEGLRHVRGQLIARMDADDVCMPERLALQVGFMARNPGIVAVGTAFEVMDHRGRRLTALYPPRDHGAIDRKLLQGHCPISHPSAMIRRETLQRVGGYRERFAVAQDLDLWLRVAEVGRLANIERPLIAYRLSNDALSLRSGERQLQMAREACEDAWRRRGVAGTFKQEGHWRPLADRNSRHRFALRYGWWAFNFRQRRTAIVYGCRAIALNPLSRDGWTLLACSLIKRLPSETP